MLSHLSSCKQRCLDCPISYHITCIPPASRFHELALLCHEHYRNKLPDLDKENSFQAEVEAFADVKLKEIRKKRRKKLSDVDVSDQRCIVNFPENSDESNLFLPGMKGHIVSPEHRELAALLENKGEACNGRSAPKPIHLPFCLPCDYQKEVSFLVMEKCWLCWLKL